VAIAALVPVAVVVSAQTAPTGLLDEIGSLPSIPGPSPITIQPRIFSAYASLTGAAMLTLLYLFRGRAFIIHWIGSWLMLSTALGLVARDYADPVLASVLTAGAALLVVWSAGLLLLAATAFPQNRIDWRGAIRWVGITAVVFLASPFAVPLIVVVGTGVAATAALLGWAGVRYLQIARRSRHIGAILIGAGAWIIAVVNVGAAIAFVLGAAGTPLGRLTAINVVTSLFVALGMHLLVFEDMTQELRLTNRDLAAANEEVKRLAITDPLTGCHNRRFFDEIERREIQRHRRYSSPMSVMFVDVNHFKRLNDSLGHDRGDDVLRTIGLLLRRHVRESDYVIRWGGDEFLLMLTCSETEAQAKAEELKVAFTRERAATAVPDYVGLSIGVASLSRGADTLREAIRYADSRMYRDKLALRQAAL
jgi:diguanylate cyclase (GGDEF)-like protein